MHFDKMDINNTAIYHKNDTTYDEGGQLPKTVIVFFVAIISLAVTVTNVLNLVILRKTQQIPEIAKICLLNLSIADLTSGIVCMTPCIASAILEYWPYGDVWCQIAGVFHGTCCAVSIWSLSVVSVDRYLAIKKPLRYHTLMTPRRSVGILTSLWSLGFGTFLLPILISKDLMYYEFIPATLMCGLYWKFRWLCIVTGVYIPLASGFIIVYTSTGIIKETVFKRNTVSPSGSSHMAHPVDLRALKILCITASVYFTAWGPYVIDVMWASFTSSVNVSPGVQFGFMWLANSNSFMNVFIYSMIYKSFRLRAKQLILGILCCDISSREPLSASSTQST